MSIPTKSDQTPWIKMEIHPLQNSLLEEDLYKLVADQKWKQGFVCRKCGHTNYCKGKKVESRRCTKCKTEESAIAHTIFHHCRLPLHEAFQLAAAVCCDPKASTYTLSKTFDRRQMTCWKFRTRITECLTHPEKEHSLKSLLTQYQILTQK